jgi:hypothetical protein
MKRHAVVDSLSGGCISLERQNFAPVGQKKIGW